MFPAEKEVGTGTRSSVLPTYVRTVQFGLHFSVWHVFIPQRLGLDMVLVIQEEVLTSGHMQN